MVTVRKEISQDIAAIHRVNELAFEQPDEANLIDKLREHGKALLSLIAEEGGQIVGHILFSPVTIIPKCKNLSAVGLAPMAVLPEWQNRGIGSLLVRTGLEECQRMGFDFVVVLGHPNYYPRFGFVPSVNYQLKSEYDVPDEVFMVLELRQSALSGCSGLVKYEPEFNEV